MRTAYQERENLQKQGLPCPACMRRMVLIWTQQSRLAWQIRLKYLPSLHSNAHAQRIHLFCQLPLLCAYPCLAWPGLYRANLDPSCGD